MQCSTRELHENDALDAAMLSVYDYYDLTHQKSTKHLAKTVFIDSSIQLQKWTSNKDKRWNNLPK